MVESECGKGGEKNGDGGEDISSSFVVASNIDPRLADFVVSYEKQKYKLSASAKKEILGLMEELQWGNVGESDVYRLNTKLNEEIQETSRPIGWEKTYRGLVKDNIDIILFPETLWESDDSVKPFFHYFTLAYIDFVEKKDGVKESKSLHYEESPSGLVLKADELKQVLGNTIKRLQENGIDLTKLEFSIDISLSSGEIINQDLGKFIPKYLKFQEQLKDNADWLNTFFNNGRIDKRISRNDADIIIQLKEKYDEMRLCSKELRELWIRIKVGKLSGLDKDTGRDKITGRNDINNVDFIINIVGEIEDGDLNMKDIEEILIDGYYLAFKHETSFGDGKKGIETIRKYESIWREQFGTNIRAHKEVGKIISIEEAEELYLLSWIESNGKPKAQSKANALGIFQVLHNTAKWVMKEEGGDSITQADMFDPIKSGEYASRFLGDKLLPKYIKKKPGLSADEYIKYAIREYNGGWIKKLKAKYLKESLVSIFQIVSLLSNVKKMPNVSRAKKALQIIQDKYFNNHTFPPLEKGNSYNNNTQINQWIDRYIKKIIKQQMMYPYQFLGIQKLYEEKNKKC